MEVNLEEIWGQCQSVRNAMIHEQRDYTYEHTITNLASMWLNNRTNTRNPMTGQPYGEIMQPETHTCDNELCSAYLQTISKRLGLYGCLLSGFTHLCASDSDTCAWQYPDRVGNQLCVYSGAWLGRTTLNPYQSLRNNVMTMEEAVMSLCQETDVIAEMSRRMLQAPPPMREIAFRHGGTESVRRKGGGGGGGGGGERETVKRQRKRIVSSPAWGREGKPGGDSGVGASGKRLKREAFRGINTWTGRRAKTGAHRLGPTAKLGTYVPARMTPPAFISETMSLVLCDDLQTGDAFATFCMDLEEDAKTLMAVVITDGPVRRMHEQNVRKDLLDKVRKKIVDYAKRCAKVGLAPNMHVMDNLYDSHMAGLLGIEAAGAPIPRGAFFARATMYAKGGVVAWLVYMLTIGGYPFVGSSRGRRVSDEIFATKERAQLVEKATGKIHPTSYYTCFRRFVLGFVFRVGQSGFGAEPLLDQDQDIYRSIPSHDILEGISITAAGLALQREKYGRAKRKMDSESLSYTGSLGLQLEMILNGRLLSRTSLKESNMILTRFAQCVALAKCNHVLRQGILLVGANFSPPREEEHLLLPHEPANLLLDTGNPRGRSPYTAVLSMYADMPSV